MTRTSTVDMGEAYSSQREANRVPLGVNYLDPQTLV